MAFLDQTIDWANYAESWDKIAFFKEFIQFFGHDELNCVRGILNRKRKKEIKVETEEEPRLWKGPRLFTGCNHDPVRSPSQDVTTPEEISPQETKDHWSKQIAPRDFVAFDVEAAQRYVKFLDPNGKMWRPLDVPLTKHAEIEEKEPLMPKAAFLAVVDFNGNTVCQETVQHLPGTYRVDYWSKKTANITSTQQLKFGKPFDKVVQSFLGATNGKYLITCGGGSDFRYLELVPTSFRQFDLQAFYQRPSQTNPAKNEPMNLRDIYFYHFHEDFQRGPHNATKDAKATMKIFREGYCKLDFNQEYDFSNVPNLRKYAEKSLFYCKTKNDFIQLCKCTSCNNVEV